MLILTTLKLMLGLEIDIWYIDYGFPWANCLNLLNPYDESRDICAGQIWKVSAPNKTVMDYRTYEGTLNVK